MAAAIRLSQQHSCSFDHLVGEREQPVGNLEAECLGNLEVDHKLKLGRLYDRQVSGLLALKNSRGIDAGPSQAVVIVWAVTHQAACIDEDPLVIDGRHAVSCCPRDE